MSTVASVVKRPESAPKASVYPRLVTWANSTDKSAEDEVVVLALGPSTIDPSTDFRGVVVSGGKTLWKTGEYFENFTKTYWNDFPDAVLLYNK